MPRTASWLPRLYDITRSVIGSVRSHYDRRDLQKLFELQPRAAQKLFEMLPTTEVGTSQLVDREALATFLQHVREAEEPALLFENLRQAKTASSRKKMRSLIRSDFAPAPLASLPPSITLSQGRMEVSFESVEELAESLMQVALILSAEVDEFAVLYAPQKPPKPQDHTEADDVRRMFAELKEMEALKAKELEKQ